MIWATAKWQQSKKGLRSVYMLQIKFRKSAHSQCSDPGCQWIPTFSQVSSSSVARKAFIIFFRPDVTHLVRVYG
jgi:hypothetical protein